MKLEDQVAPLALAQRMKDLGFPQQTYFCWMGAGGRHAEPWIAESTERLGVHTIGMLCAAPTVAEIGERLPERAISGRTLAEEPLPWFASTDPDPDGDERDVYGATEAEARARLWIALAEAGAPP